MNERDLAKIYKKVHNIMRNEDGLQPQESFTELLKYLFLKLESENNENNIKALNAKELNKALKRSIEKDKGWISKTWTNKKFQLSNNCLLKIHDELKDIYFNKIDFDIKSQAIQEFLSPQLRKGLGIFLTPSPIVKSIIDYLKPKKGSTICDPACGSGTFLLECAKLDKTLKLIGVDKNPRMLLLAYLNLNSSTSSLNFKCLLDDSLFSNNDLLNNDLYDYVITNPPFGVNLDSRTNDFSLYNTCIDSEGNIVKKQSSEIVFLEKCLKILKPNGTLAIVIPKGIATNSSLSLARESLSKFGYVDTIFALPSETFSSTGTQTTTIVLFVKKFDRKKDSSGNVNLAIANIKNVGYDSTGRYRKGSELESLSATIINAKKSNTFNKSNIDILSLPKEDTFSSLTNIFVIKNSNKNQNILKDYVEEIHTGRTPNRKAYSSRGYFLIKVGNLTGSGINWQARERNFVDENEIDKRRKSQKSLIVRKGDILLTSSAHNSMYIAKKSDIIDEIPNWVNQDVSFVGEVMMIRPKGNIDAYKLLAYLKIPFVIFQIQNMVRGQTAHLHSQDLANLTINETILNSKKIDIISKELKKQNKLSKELNDVNYKISQKLEVD